MKIFEDIYKEVTEKDTDTELEQEPIEKGETGEEGEEVEDPLDVAIEKFEGLAQEFLDKEDEESAKENTQLADWLKELKKFKAKEEKEDKKEEKESEEEVEEVEEVKEEVEQIKKRKCLQCGKEIEAHRAFCSQPCFEEWEKELTNWKSATKEEKVEEDGEGGGMGVGDAGGGEVARGDVGGDIAPVADTEGMSSHEILGSGDLKQGILGVSDFRFPARFKEIQKRLLAVNNYEDFTK